MSDLARRKDARDLWVSRSHLHAAGALALLGGLICFGAGYALGRTGVAVIEAPRHASLTGEVPGRELVELLAEVERAAMVHPSSAMRYPDWATRGDDLKVPMEAPSEAQATAVVPPPPMPAQPMFSGAPEDGWTVSVGVFAAKEDARSVRDHLDAQGVSAWVAQQLVDGRPAYWVGVDAFDDEAAALDAMPAVQAALDGTSVAVGAAVALPAASGGVEPPPEAP